jgi:hypothetical protein
MPEKKSLPVTVTRSASELTVEMDPEDLIGFKQGDGQVTRVNLVLAGENVVVLEKISGGKATPGPLPGLTEEEISAYLIEATDEVRGETGLRARIETALDASMDRCARCKVCNVQVDAVMAALGYPPRDAS